jgi:hypothetical protein
VRLIDVTPEIVDVLGGGDGFSFRPMRFEDFSSGKAEFFAEGPDVDHRVIYDTMANQWQLTQLPRRSAQEMERTRCNPVYTLVNGQFNEPSCQLQTDTYRYEIFASGIGSGVRQVNLQSGAVEILTPELAPKPYSPFDTTYYVEPTYSYMSIADGRLWLASNRGLASLDIASQRWDLYDTTDGLISNQVVGFAVTPKVIWVTTEHGGLAGIKR